MILIFLASSILSFLTVLRPCLVSLDPLLHLFDLDFTLPCFFDPSKPDLFEPALYRLNILLDIPEMQVEGLALLLNSRGLPVQVPVPGQMYPGRYP